MSIAVALIDNREPPEIRALTFGGAQTVCSQLDAGDLLATTADGALLAIERKTPNDLLNSLRDDRLWSQLAGIRKLTPWAYLVVTGELRRGSDGHVVTEARSTGWDWAAVQGALLQVQEMGVFIVACAGENDYEAAVLRLARRKRNPELAIPPVREAVIASPAERILLSLPSIGLERATVLLNHCHNVAWTLAFLTSADDTEKTFGIGPGVKRNIRQALGLAENEELAVINSG